MLRRDCRDIIAAKVENIAELIEKQRGGRGEKFRSQSSHSLASFSISWTEV